MLKDKVAVITGGTRGIGLEIARVFLENQAKVVIFGSRQESVQKAQAKLAQEGYEVGGFFPNLSDFDALTQTVAQIVEQYGRIDILVNNAGVAAEKPLEQTAVEEMEQVVDLNLMAVMKMTKAVVPQMRQQGGGVILNTSSMVSIYGQPAGVAYPASKFAVNGLTKSLARELAPAGIRVNAVAPGVIRTDMVAKLPPAVIEPLVKTIPLGRMGEPRDVANAFLYLASEMASYVTGAILSVDGAARS